MARHLGCLRSRWPPCRHGEQHRLHGRDIWSSQQLPTPTLLLGNLSLCCVCPQQAKAAGSIPFSPCVPLNQVGQHPTERPRGSSSLGLGSQRWGHTGKQPPADGNGFSSHEDRARVLSSGLVSPSRHLGSTHGALTRSLVFDEEELQPLLEGVFIHVELDLHPAGKAPREAHQQGGRLDPEPPRSPVPPSELGDPPEQPTADPRLSPGLPAAPTIPNDQFPQP